MLKVLLIIESIVLTLLVIQIAVILFQPHELNYPKESCKERWNDLKFSVVIAGVLALHMVISHGDILKGWIMLYG